MPRLDGYQTCALIKNNSEFRAMPVIMLSSKDGLFDKAKGRIVGSDQYLTKPFSRNELIGAIQQHVEGERLSAAGQEGVDAADPDRRRLADGSFKISGLLKRARARGDSPPHRANRPCRSRATASPT